MLRVYEIIYLDTQILCGTLISIKGESGSFRINLSRVDNCGAKIFLALMYVHIQNEI